MMNIAKLIDAARRDQKTTSVYAAVGGVVFLIILLVKITGFGLWDHYMTLSAIIQSLAFALLAMKVQKNDVGGLSPSMLIAYCISYVARLSTTLTLKGYVPEDMTGDVYIYQLSELVGLVIVGYCLYVVLDLRQKSADFAAEISAENQLVIPGMVLGCLIMGFMTMSDGHQHFLGDLLWMFAQWMESVAIIPQLWLVSKKKEIERRTSHFIALMIVARVCITLFWSVVMLEIDLYLNFKVGLIVTNAIHLLVCGDYMYYFVKTIQAPKMMLPGTEF